MKSASEVQPIATAHTSTPFRAPTAKSRFARLVLLLTAAGTLSFFLPNLWARDDAVLRRVAHPLSALVDPASEWKDDEWPLREQTPWDISTDFPFPRKLEYTVTEGTWLRLDVHPESGDIVFDMLGDIYCLPGETYARESAGTDSPVKAHPVLLGVPHDSDPHFSPEGDKLVFRSDAGLGLENIWVVEWNGCDEMNIRPEQAQGELMHALVDREVDDDMLASGVKETELRKKRRLLREGRLKGESNMLNVK